MDAAQRAHQTLKQLAAATEPSRIDALMRRIGEDATVNVQMAQALSSARILAVRARRKEAQSMGPGPWGETPWPASTQLQIGELGAGADALLRSVLLAHVVEIAKDEIKHVLDWYEYEIWLAKQSGDPVWLAQSQGAVAYINMAKADPIAAVQVVG